VSLEFNSIRNIYQPDQCAISIEIFPPKTEEGDAALGQTLERLARYQPAFISCTYGAGGSTSKRTITWCERIQQQYGISATAHFTCVGSTRDDLCEWLHKARESGIRNIMALRGDIPQGETEFQAVDGGLKYANELVTLIREVQPDMGIGVAGYPEKHLECPTMERDLENLKRKVDSGADAVFTQLFYDNTHFLDFQNRCDQLGILQPIIPGIMPITNFARIQRITQMCGAIIPEELHARLAAAQDDNQAQFEIGVDHAIAQCRELITAGVPGIHFYVLNKANACERILDALDMTTAPAT